MTNFEQAALDRMIRLRESYSRGAQNPPPALRIKALAKRFGISEHQVTERARSLRKKK